MVPSATYYRTLNGAQVGDLFVSLIHTCELMGANPFDYLSELQRHARELADNPSVWMPWNYTGQNQSSSAMRQRHSKMAGKRASQRTESDRL
jgi:hypothetical protein